MSAWEPPVDAIRALREATWRTANITTAEDVLVRLHGAGWHLVRDEPTPDRCQDGER